ncbi:MAG: hypothetical protein AVDCRST_MAG26-2204 [uncultured Chloroflexia bacterium]|uniref:Squalene cyclase C-terminal domain-containing protein n=1 Tax=uncultured Chloroflexia bacterium TaxID=1672391 RepID=A0A6J4IQG0_9CHLR|nr:MAG: hypothetical protein AVDCRST_MAG26-2204 [uncultured Chloroflexia bacterium]
MSSVAPHSERRAVHAIASTAYDTAWLASLPCPDAPNVPRFPMTLAWIPERQLPDGSWGSYVPYVPERIVCTLSALVALARFDQEGSFRSQILAGERYLWQHVHILGSEPCELVAFELLLPSLIERAVDSGIDVPPHVDQYRTERQAKLALLPIDKIYSPALTTSHALEFLGRNADASRLPQAQLANGSIGNSPAATAFLLEHVEDSAAASYLAACLVENGDGGVPVLAPCERFELLWVAYHRFLGGVSPHALLSEQQCVSLVDALSRGGVSLSPSFQVPDADDTAVALLLLHASGVMVSPNALTLFEHEDHFVSFPFERHPSTGVNIHVLAALNRYNSYPRREIAMRKILRFLDRTRNQGSYWTDKWHLSPLYATSHAIAALVQVQGSFDDQVVPMIDAAIEWILHIQNADGSWGFRSVPTAEETAYALVGLSNAPARSHRIRAAIEAGADYLGVHQSDSHPALWMDKCLYYPAQIVDSIIAAALSLAGNGGAPGGREMGAVPEETLHE